MKGDQPKRPRGARGKKKGKTEDLPPDPIDTAAGGPIPGAAEASEDAPRAELADAHVEPERSGEESPVDAATEEPSATEEPTATEEPAAEAAPEEPAEEHPVTSVPPPPESSEQISAAPAPAPKGKRGKKAPAAPKAAKPGPKGKRGKGKDEIAAPPESSKKLLGETEAEEADGNEDTWHGSDPEATVNLRGELADLFPLRDDNIVLTETDETEEPAPGDDGTSSESESDDDDVGLDVGNDEGPVPESAEAKVADPTTTARDHLRGLIEALVFASDKPLSVRELSRASEAPSKDVKVLLEELRVFYKPRGIQLDEVAGGFVFRTNAVFAPFVRDLTKQKPVKLTRAQLETLAILAYRQPITRPEIDDIRGVDSGPVLKMLLERDLVRILGKKDEPGRPLLYGSTPEFLEFFGLKSLKDLPTLQEFTELNEDSKRVAEKELGESFDDIQTLLDHGEEDAAPEAAGTGEAHDTEIPPAFADPEAADDWDGAPTLDAAEGETAADTDAPSAPTAPTAPIEDPELEEEPEPPTQDQDALTSEEEPLDENPVASADEDAVAPVSEEDPNLDEAGASEATVETPSKTPATTEESTDEEDDYDDDDFEDDDDDDDDEADEDEDE